MADNYLEKRMEEYRSGKSGIPRRKLTPSGKKPGEVSFSLGVRRVFVTGGASGIGREVVKAYCDAGCRVAFCDVDEKRGTATAQAVGARFIPLDVADAPALERCVAQLFHDWGDIDIVVNNVGIGMFRPFVDTTLEDFDRVMAVNIRPIFIVSRAMALHRASQAVMNTYGRIINIASTRALQSEADTIAYSASKGAIVSMTHSLMMSMAPYGVTCNCISPGWIVTDPSAELSDADRLQHPSARVGCPRDIANMCLYLSVPENNFINGENLVIDGGMTRKMIYVE